MNLRHIFSRSCRRTPPKRRVSLTPFVTISVAVHLCLLLALPAPRATVQPPAPALVNVTLVRPPEREAAAPALQRQAQPERIPETPPDRNTPRPAQPPASTPDAPAPREATVSLHEPAHKDSGLRDYLAHMRARIDSVWDYPDDARQEQLQGMSTLRFTVDSGGRIAQIVTVKSSGHALLDRASETTIRHAEPFQPLPEECGLERLTVLASFHYSLYGE